MLSLKLQIIAPLLSKAFLDIQATIEFRLTLKRVSDMITYSSILTAVVKTNNECNIMVFVMPYEKRVNLQGNNKTEN